MYADRSKEIAYESLPRLFFLGEYTRRLPVSMARMMENAYDWEHLPYIHASTFESIHGFADGPWGWRARVVLRDESSDRFNESAGAVGADDQSRVQDVELLVDRSRNYWATTVLSGVGVGLQIHTQATSLAEREIEIAVRFYLPKSYARQLAFLGFLKRVLPHAAYAFVAHKAGLGQVRREATPAESLYTILEDQYALLYDEDLGLMSERQTALDRRAAGRAKNAHRDDEREAKAGDGESVARLCIASLSELENATPHIVEWNQRRYCLNRWRGEWVIYAADCPHMLGPLEAATIDDDGIVSCPWHGYRFRVTTGESCDKSKAADLPPAPRIQIEDGRLYLVEALSRLD